MPRGCFLLERRRGKAIKQNVTLPAYAGGRPFQVLLSLATASGMRVEFARIPDNVYARSRGMLIQMPLDERFHSAEHAAVVLGHELAHSLVNARHAPPDKDHPAPLAADLLVEAECDHLGAYFYMLALRIAQQEAADDVTRALAPEGSQPPA